MTVLITLTIAGTDSGPFDLYSNLDGYVSAFETGVSRAALLAGYSSALVPDGTLIIRVKSTGSCVNYVDILVGTTTTSTTSTTTTIAPTYTFYSAIEYTCGSPSCTIGGSTVVAVVNPSTLTTGSFYALSGTNPPYTTVYEIGSIVPGIPAGQPIMDITTSDPSCAVLCSVI